jgi:hypothetical protein
MIASPTNFFAKCWRKFTLWPLSSQGLAWKRFGEKGSLFSTPGELGRGMPRPYKGITREVGLSFRAIGFIVLAAIQNSS